MKNRYIEAIQVCLKKLFSHRKQAEETLRAYEQLAALYKVAQAITAPLQLDVVLDTIARSTVELLGTDTGVILLLDEADKTLRIRGAYGLSEIVVKGTCDRLGESIAGRVVQHGKPIIANDLPHDPRFYNPSTVNEGLLACASVPLRIGGRIIGTLDVHSKTDRWAFNESHIQILEMLASQATIAIENAKLYERLQQAHDELEKRVQERTAELVTTNKRLRHEIEVRNRIEKKLEEERNLLRTLIDNLPDYIFIKDTNSRFLLVNTASLRPAKAKTADELVGKTDFDLFPSKLAEQYYTDDQEIIRTGQPLLNQEEPGIDLEVGAKQWRLTTKVPFRDSQGNIIGLVGISRDITEQKQAKETLQQRNQELVMLNYMNEMLQVCHTEEETYKVIMHVCKQLFPKDSGCLYILEPSQTSIETVVRWGESPPQPEILRVEEFWDFQQDQNHVTPPAETDLLYPYVKTSSEYLYLCFPISIPDNSLVVFHLHFGQKEAEYSDAEWQHRIESKQIIFTRIAEQYALFLGNLRLRETLKSESIQDPLTGLYNRRYMEASLEREAYRVDRYNSRLGIIMLDIDHFKQFNDRYGHDAGDIALRELGTFLLKHTRGEDIACRYGGEEFLLIMPGASLEITNTRAEELWLGLRNLRIEYQAQLLSFTVSVGVAALPEHGPGVKNAVKASDIALYQAKSEGRNRVIVAPL